MGDFEQEYVADDTHNTDFDTDQTVQTDEDDRKLFVGGLSSDSKEDQIKEYFEKFGHVEKCQLKIDPETLRSRCFAFVLFADVVSVKKALAAGTHRLGGRNIDPKLANKREVNTKVFVGGLCRNATDDDIKNYFGKYGKIKEMDLPVDVNDKRRGFCFITYETKEGMENATAVRMQDVLGKQCEVKKSVPKPGGRGGYGDRGGGRGGGRGYGYQPYSTGGYGSGYGSYGAGYGGGYGTSYGGYGSGYGGGYDDYYGYGGYGDGGWGGYDSSGYDSYGYGSGYQSQQSGYGKYPKTRGRGGYGSY